MLFPRSHGTVAHFLTQQDYQEFAMARCTPAALGWIEKAKRNMDLYTVIGIVERMEESLRLLERRIPAIFSGVVHHYVNQPRSAYRGTTSSNDEGGASVTDKAQMILRSNPCNDGEFALWDYARKLFMRSVSKEYIDL